jgi:hypothetical protein
MYEADEVKLTVVLKCKRKDSHTCKSGTSKIWASENISSEAPIEMSPEI